MWQWWSDCRFIGLWRVVQMPLNNRLFVHCTMGSNIPAFTVWGKMKLNEFANIQAKLDQENFWRMVRWARWYCSPQYWLSHLDGEGTFLFLSNRRDRETNPNLYNAKGSGANQHPRAPRPQYGARRLCKSRCFTTAFKNQNYSLYLINNYTL